MNFFHFFFFFFFANEEFLCQALFRNYKHKNRSKNGEIQGGPNPLPFRVTIFSLPVAGLIITYHVLTVLHNKLV